MSEISSARSSKDDSRATLFPSLYHSRLTFFQGKDKRESVSDTPSAPKRSVSSIKPQKEKRKDAAVSFAPSLDEKDATDHNTNQQSSFQEISHNEIDENDDDFGKNFFEKVLDTLNKSYKLHFRFAQLALSFMAFISILVFGAQGGGWESNVGFYLFTCILTMIITGGIIAFVYYRRKSDEFRSKVISMTSPQYFIYGALAFDFVWFFFWMSAASAVTGSVNYYKASKECAAFNRKGRNCEAGSAAAAFGFFNWFLFIVTISISIRSFMIMHKNSGLFTKST